MMLLLYAIEEATAGEGNGKPPRHGLADEPLSTLTSGELSAIVSDVERPPDPTPSNLLAYERVVERLMTGGTVLPARFASTAETEQEVKAMLIERQSEFLEALQRVEGAVEFAVRIPQDEAHKAAEDEQPQTGSEYMQRLVDTNRNASDVAAQVENATRGLTISTRRTTRSLACLVNKQAATEFVNRTRAKGLMVTGPWPPYSFVGR